MEDNSSEVRGLYLHKKKLENTIHEECKRFLKHSPVTIIVF